MHMPSKRLFERLSFLEKLKHCCPDESLDFYQENYLARSHILVCIHWRRVVVFKMSKVIECH